MKTEQLYNLFKESKGVSTDTRAIKNGEMFFALWGSKYNGNLYATEALERGALVAVIDDPLYETDKTVLVDDCLFELQALAAHHRKELKIPVLAITGTNGKTTTKELIAAIMARKLKVHYTKGNLNNHIGVPLTILSAPPETEMMIVEMGANHIGEIASYCRIALPNYGIITNCGKAHLEGFGSEEGVKKGKGELFDHLRANNGTAFVMWDYDYLRDMSKGISNIFKYGTAGADIEGHVTKSEPFLEVAIDKGIKKSSLKHSW